MDNITLVMSNVVSKSYESRPKSGTHKAAYVIGTAAPMPGDKLVSSSHGLSRAKIAEAVPVFHIFISCSLINLWNKFTLSL